MTDNPTTQFLKDIRSILTGAGLTRRDRKGLMDRAFKHLRDTGQITRVRYVNLKQKGRR